MSDDTLNARMHNVVQWLAERLELEFVTMGNFTSPIVPPGDGFSLRFVAVLSDLRCMRILFFVNGLSTLEFLVIVYESPVATELESVNKCRILEKLAEVAPSAIPSLLLK